MRGHAQAGHQRNEMQVAEIRDEATQATLIIAQKLGTKGVDVKDLLTGVGLDKVKLEMVSGRIRSRGLSKRCHRSPPEGGW